MLFNWYLLGTVKTHYLAVLVGFGILYGLSFVFMCLKVKEGDYPTPEPVQSSSPWNPPWWSKMYTLRQRGSET